MLAVHGNKLTGLVLEVGMPVAACTRWLMGAEASTKVCVTWSTTESATQRSTSHNFSHSCSAVWSNVALHVYVYVGMSFNSNPYS